MFFETLVKITLSLSDNLWNLVVYEQLKKYLIGYAIDGDA